ncbi:mitochondrial import inner membrane translocase subunit Tim54 [Dichotomocladium elegans]|nr:mitochondrial import inner membrane translocase subunit Tim54 [Dichotomocladium elegans]
MSGDFQVTSVNVFNRVLYCPSSMSKLPFGLKAPSKGTVIFCSVASAVAGTVFASKHYANEARQLQCERVAFLGRRTCAVNEKPRKIAVYLLPPPGDSMEKSRVWFNDYIKPILVAGAVDYDVKEGRDAEVIESAVCEEIVKLRRRELQQRENRLSVDDKDAAESRGLTAETLYKQIILNDPRYPEQSSDAVLKRAKETSYDGIIAVGRLAWGGVLRGVEKGCHASLVEPELPMEPKAISESTADGQGQTTLATEAVSAQEETVVDAAVEQPPSQKIEGEHEQQEHVLLQDHAAGQNDHFSIPKSLSPVMYIPHENIIGWKNIPYRIYRWVTDYTRINEVGEYAVAVVLKKTRPLLKDDIDVGYNEKVYWIGEDADKISNDDKPIVLEEEVRNALETYTSEDWA